MDNGENVALTNHDGVLRTFGLLLAPARTRAALLTLKHFLFLVLASTVPP